MEDEKSKNDRELKSAPVFYYSREHRLNKASAAVQAFNEDSTAKVGIIQRIFVTKRNALLFVPIVLICIVFSLANRMDVNEKNIKLGGNTISVLITDLEGALILDIVKSTPKNGQVFSGAADIAVSPVVERSKDDESRDLPPVFQHRVFFTSSETDTFSITLPFEENEFFVIFRTSDEYKSLKLKAVKPQS